MTARRDSNFDDYLAETLKDPAEAAAYIEATLELEDMDALLVALRHVARAHGMADVARRAELGEKTLFRALGKDGNRPGGLRIRYRRGRDARTGHDRPAAGGPVVGRATGECATRRARTA